MAPVTRQTSVGQPSNNEMPEPYTEAENDAFFESLPAEEQPNLQITFHIFALQLLEEIKDSDFVNDLLRVHQFPTYPEHLTAITEQLEETGRIKTTSALQHDVNSFLRTTRDIYLEESPEYKACAHLVSWLPGRIQYLKQQMRVTLYQTKFEKADRERFKKFNGPEYDSWGRKLKSRDEEEEEKDRSLQDKYVALPDNSPWATMYAPAWEASYSPFGMLKARWI